MTAPGANLRPLVAEFARVVAGLIEAREGADAASGDGEDRCDRLDRHSTPRSTS